MVVEYPLLSVDVHLYVIFPLEVKIPDVHSLLAHVPLTVLEAILALYCRLSEKVNLTFDLFCKYFSLKTSIGVTVIVDVGAVEEGIVNVIVLYVDPILVPPL
jgi:hypothetical protein